MRHYRETAKRRCDALARQRDVRRTRAWEVARAAGDFLRKRFHAQKIWVFGSLLQDDLFHDHSDVDLAAWGVRQEDILKAVAEVTSLDSDISVDLVVFEDASDSLRRTIQAEGRPL
ncbi:Predicted nucleotidyltransferase [Desulfonatronum zhilinae]|nr:Predicted nucleotidyltransferase [Desulfonatronum zhilinae]